MRASSLKRVPKVEKQVGDCDGYKKSEILEIKGCGGGFMSLGGFGCGCEGWFGVLKSMICDLELILQ